VAVRLGDAIDCAGLRSDADVAVVGLDAIGAVSRAAVLSGSFITYRGAKVLHSGACDAAVSFGPAGAVASARSGEDSVLHPHALYFNVGDFAEVEVPASEYGARVVVGEGCPEPPRAPVSGDLPLPPAPPDVVVRASSIFRGLEPQCVVDEAWDRFWNSLPGLALPQWIEVDFKGTMKVQALTVRSMTCAAYRVEVTSPGSSLLGEVSGLTGEAEREFEVGAEVERIRITATESTAPAGTVGIRRVTWR